MAPSTPTLPYQQKPRQAQPHPDNRQLEQKTTDKQNQTAGVAANTRENTAPKGNPQKR